MKTQQATKDQRIRELHEQANRYWPEIESVIDELKALGTHSLDGDNALLNVRDRLRQLSTR